MEKYQRSARQSPLNFHRHKNTLKEFSHHLLDLGLRRNRSEQDDCYPDDFLTKYASNYYIFGSKGAKALIPPALQQSSQVGLRESVELKKIDELSYGSAVERVSGLVLRGYTNNQLLRDIDAVAMSHSLEVRVPYLDPVIADLSLSLPDNAKLGDTEKFKHSNQITYRSSGAKRILIDVGRSILPVDFDLQPKRGFGMPFDAWLHGPLNVIFEDTLSNSCVRERELLKTDEVQNIRKRYYEGKTGWAQPWLLMMLELWCREVLDSTIDL
jgi:asparagine synthase (glutamine-hydrolysing)